MIIILICYYRMTWTLSQWSNTWQLHFNLTKCTSIHFGHGNKQHQYSILIQHLSLSDVEKDLGVLVRSDLKSSSHVSAIVQKAEKCLAVLKKNIVSRNKEVYLKLYKQIVKPQLEYAVYTWNPYFLRDIELIERVQHRATKCVEGMQSKSYADRLTLLGIESLQTRRCFFDLIEVHKILNNLTSLGPDQLFTYDLSQRTRGHNFKLKIVHCQWRRVKILQGVQYCSFISISYFQPFVTISK